MKNSLFLFGALFFCISCKAQDSNFKKSFVHANKESYNVKDAMLNRKTVSNTKDSHIYNAKPAKPAPKVWIRPKPGDVSYDKNLAAKIFYNSFTDVRLKKLAEEDLTLQVSYNIDIQGNILDISFSFPINSSITPVEIEKLETQLKTQIKFTVNQQAYQYNTFIPLNYFTVFKRLVDHAPSPII